MKNKATPAKQEELLPFVQKLLSHYKEEFDILVKHFPTIAVSCYDLSFSLNLSNLLLKAGFKLETTEESGNLCLIRNIDKWVKNGCPLLLQHNTTASDGVSLIDILKVIRKKNPQLSFTRIFPVMTLSYRGQQQQETLRILSSFGIEQVIFLTPDAPLETTLEEVVKELAHFARFLQRKEEKLTPSAATKEKERGTEEEQNAELTLKAQKHFESLLLRGSECIRKGKYEEAIQIFTKAIDIKPDYNTLIKRGDSFYAIKRFIDALYDYRRAHDIEKTLPVPYTNISRCCFSLIKEEMKHNGKEQAEKWLTLAISCLNNARKLIDEMRKRTPDMLETSGASPYHDLVETLAETDIREFRLKGEKAFNEAVSRIIESSSELDFTSDDFDIDSRIDQAILLTRFKQYEKAEKIFRELIAVNTELVCPVFNNFAIELRKNGQDEKAFAIYQELLSLENIPDYDIVLENFRRTGLIYAQHLRKEFRHDEAIRVYKKILSKKTEEKEWVLCELASAYMELKMETEASLRLVEAVFLNGTLTEQEKFTPYKNLSSLSKRIIERLNGLP